jgi:hypothetical protein
MSSIRCLACVAAALLAAVAGCESTASSNVDSTGLEEIVLNADGEYPCILQFEPTGLVIRPDPGGAHPDPGGHLAKGTDGTFYTSTPGGGQVLAWSEAGEFLRTIGTPGPGPGELGTALYPTADMHGTVHVIDSGQGRWNRYASDGTFLSVTASPHFQTVHPVTSALISSDTLLTANPGSPTPGTEGQFHLLGSDGQVLSAFGRITPPPPGRNNYARNISPAGDNGFWAGPLHGSPEYLLEEWSLAGTLKRRIRREVSWYAEAAASVVPGGFPVIIRPFLGSGGHLIVMTTIPPTTYQLNGSEGEVLWYEVIDPDRQLVLASLKIAPDEYPPRFDLEPGTEMGFRVVSDELGFRSYEILRYSLSPRDASSRALCGG